MRGVRLIKGFSQFSVDEGAEYVMADTDGNCMYHCVEMCVKNTRKSTMKGQRRQRNNAKAMVGIISKYPNLRNHKWFKHDSTSWSAKQKSIQTNGSHGGIFALILLSIYHGVLFEVMDVAVSNKRAYKYWPSSRNGMADVFAGKNIKRYTLLQYADHYDLLRTSCSNDDQYEEMSQAQWVDLWIEALDVWNQDR